jgi:RimJ/RimL family protein N-acetyltransferase
MTPPSGPAYRLLTQRLVLRCWDPQDAPLLKRAVDESREHLKPWMPWAHGEPETVDAYVQRLRQARAKFDLGQDFTYGIFDPSERTVLGGTGLHTRLGEGAREIGYWIHRDHLNQGLATEVSAALVRVAFEVDRVSRVEIHCDPRNVRSAAVPRKLGFTLEAVLRQRTPFLDEPRRDSMIWTLFAEDYPATPAAQASVEAFDVVGQRLL